MAVRRFFFIIIVCVYLSACSGRPLPSTPTVAFSPTQVPRTPTSSLSPSPLAHTTTPLPTDQPELLRIAVIGDYGNNSKGETSVASLVASWEPDLVITTGDNNYPSGSASTIDANIGQYYHQFVYPYTGAYPPGANQNRFFPSLGNHDWVATDAQPYLDYFTLPGNERYYNFSVGSVEFFAIDSDIREPDGVDSTSTQAVWLKTQLEASTANWKIIFFHHPPYSSALHGSQLWMRWPFKTWGADLVLSGHDHMYERFDIEGLTYIVDGLGGASIYDFILPVQGSQFRYNGNYGALLIEASLSNLYIRFINIDGQVIDDFTIHASP